MLPYPSKSSVMDRRWKPSVEQAPNCPRCDSSNTKFCYYNNYSLAQPRYFCKGCRRYWTKGGSLRNVPVGGGCRKNQRGKSVRISTNHIRPIITSADHSDPNSIRPDLLLDDPSSRPPSRGSRAVPSVVVDVARSEGSDIDLALLYSKFLNPGQLVAPELMPVLELDGGNSFALAGASDCQIPVHLTQERSVVDRQRSSGRITEAELCNGLQPSNGDFSCLDPNRNSTSSKIAILPSEEEEAVDDIFWSNCSNITWQTTSQNQAFGSIHQEDHMMIPRFHPNPNWNSTFDLSSYEAFTRP